MSNPLKITISISLFHPIVGGAESQMFELGRRWVQAGHRVRVLTRPVAGSPTHEIVSGIEIHRTIRTLNFGPLFGLTFLGSLYLSLRKYAYADDVVMAAQGVWESVTNGRFSRPRCGPVTVSRVATTAECGELSLLQKTRGSTFWRRWFARNRAYLALSAEAVQELQAFGIANHSIHRITNGVDYQRFYGEPSAMRPKVVLFVGRLAPQKNPRMLIDAWNLAGCSDWTLRIVGDGPLRNELVHQALSSSLQNIEFVGSRTDMPEVYRNASVFLLPSVGEGCCNALLEAMAAGLCPIVSDIGGNREIIEHNHSGLLSAPHDVTQFADNLRQVIHSPPKLTTLAKNAQQRVLLNHDIERVAERYIELFQSLRSR